LITLIYAYWYEPPPFSPLRYDASHCRHCIDISNIYAISIFLGHCCHWCHCWCHYVFIDAIIFIDYWFSSCQLFCFSLLLLLIFRLCFDCLLMLIFDRAASSFLGFSVSSSFLLFAFRLSDAELFHIHYIYSCFDIDAYRQRLISFFLFADDAIRQLMPPSLRLFLFSILLTFIDTPFSP